MPLRRSLLQRHSGEPVPQFPQLPACLGMIGISPLTSPGLVQPVPIVFRRQSVQRHGKGRETAHEFTLCNFGDGHFASSTSCLRARKAVWWSATSSALR